MSTANNINFNRKYTIFANSDYSTAYNAYRPVYSSSLYSKIYAYHSSHSSSFSTALDVATGTVSSPKNYQRLFNKSEDLSQFQDSTFDLVTVGQAVHWFDNREKFFKEAWRILKPRGTLAMWGYTYHVIDGYPDATKKFLKLGLEILRDYRDPVMLVIYNMYRDIIIPDRLFRNIIWERCELNEKEGKMSNSESFLNEEWSVERTWSSYKSYMSKYRKENQNLEDPIYRLFEELMEEEGWKDDQILKLSWPFVLVLAEKK
ncbi:32332_t:CDS:2 [Racocetra persica]|uniref:32332_t:CDS:1 n=1 Tax=Racocetra persica TaxID=160502 RepID=A0ACA9R9J1_9GLOM|nr:32332_t:CDS:2 [Racocetra persica]